MPLIVVEGVDGSGKTTLIQNFRQVTKKLCWILARSGPPQGSLDLIDTIRLLEWGRNLSVPLIADRHPLISEPIYGPIIRGKSLIGDIWEEQTAIEQVALDVNRVIYCRPEMDIIIKSARQEKQMDGVLDNLWALYQKYDQIMARLSRQGVLVIPYDWTWHECDLNHLFLGATS